MNEEEKPNQDHSVMIPSNNFVAKFCTNIGMEVINEHVTILTLFHNVGQHNSIVIERIALDTSHLRNFVLSASEALEAIDNIS